MPVASELSLRLASALVLAVVTLALTGAGLWSFVLLIATGAVVAAWEWGRLVRGAAFDAAFFAHAGGMVAACVVLAAGYPAPGFAALAVGVLATGLLGGAGNGRRWSMLGVAYIGLPAIALVFLRSDTSYGWQAILFLFLVVWTTDSAAYLAGRNLGGPKLWRRVSPNKTWSGFVAGLMAGALVGAVWGQVEGPSSPFTMALLGSVIALLAAIGDLAESATKRAFDNKDMSNLIPGHGGLLDRVDSLLFAAIAAVAIALSRDAGAPGAALMVWP